MTAPTATVTPAVFDLEGAAAYLCMSQSALRAKAHNAEVAYFRHGDGDRSPLRFTKRALDEYLAWRESVAA